MIFPFLWVAFWAVPAVMSPAADVSWASAAAAPSSFSWRDEPQEAFRAGESILYVVKYGVIPAGFATMEVKGVERIDGRSAYRLLSMARSNKATDVFFTVRDKNESWMDVQSLCALRYRQVMREGRYRRMVETAYDPPGGRFVYRKWRKGREDRTEGSLPAYAQDVLSSLYYIRTRSLAAGQEYTLDANSGARTWPMKVLVKDVEIVKVPAGKFECLRLEPVLSGEGIFQAKGRLEVWVTNDNRKIPVRLRSRVAVGAFDAEMKEYVSGENGAKNLAEKIFPAEKEAPARDSSD